MENPKNVLKQLGLSEAEIKVYLTLTSRGALTASELTRLAHLKRPTAYYALRSLKDHGLIKASRSPGVERFQAEPPQHLEAMVAVREKELTALATEVRGMIPELLKKKTVDSGLPAVSFYEGEEAMKQAIMETVYCRSRHIDSIAPSDNFFWQVGQSFSAGYIAERVARRITTRNLWEKPLEPQIMTRSYEGISQVRILPREMIGKFRSTVFLYDDTVMYISSKDNGYVLVVKSAEHHEMMKAIYETLWSGAETTK
jgi:sugar-specific transcriptional regulator TrmB